MSKQRNVLITIVMMATALFSLYFTLKGAPRPEAVILLPGATNVQYLPESDPELTYDLREEYPAKKTIAEISRRLKAQGWETFEEHYKNVGKGGPAFREKGWRSFDSGTGASKTMERMLDRGWMNNSEDMVMYLLHYRSPQKGVKSMDKLEVRVSYMHHKKRGRR